MRSTTTRYIGATPSGADAIQQGANFIFTGADAKSFFILYTNTGKADSNAVPEEGVANTYELEMMPTGQTKSGFWKFIRSLFTKTPQYTSVTVIVGPEFDLETGLPCIECHHTTLIPNGEVIGDLAGGTGALRFLGIGHEMLIGKGEINGKPKLIKVTDMALLGGTSLTGGLKGLSQAVKAAVEGTGAATSILEDDNVNKGLNKVSVTFYNTSKNDSSQLKFTPQQNLKLREQSLEGERFRDSLRKIKYFNTFKS